MDINGKIESVLMRNSSINDALDYRRVTFF